MKTRLLLPTLLTLCWPSISLAGESCFFTDSAGMFKTAGSREAVPAEYRNSARCEKVIQKTPKKNLYSNSSSKTPEQQSSVPVQTTPNKNYDVNAYKKFINSSKGAQIRPTDVAIGTDERRAELNTSLGLSLIHI